MLHSVTRRCRILARATGAASALLVAAAAALEAQSLRGSRAAVDRMHGTAVAEGLHFYQTSDGVRRAAAAGTLVPLRNGETYRLHNVRYPYVRPEARLFVERLSAQYRQACGERLVVTSALRPHYYQRRLVNGSPRSVHPTGMAIDLRKPRNARCLSWLRRTLVSLDAAGVVEAIEEHRPPHFHVAVYPTAYRRYVDTRTPRPTPAPASGPARAAGSTPAGATYVVRSGDTLWGIAGRHGVSVADLQSANRLQNHRLVPGQRLRIPSRAASAGTAVTYRVRSGDTLWTIARRHSLTVDELKRANEISSNRLLPGQQLRIPAR